MTGRWQDLTTTEFAALDPARVVALLPVAAIEQHGPHLPLSVDADINAGILERALALLPDDAPVLALPPMPVGKSNEHQGFPGTLSLSAETLIRLWTEIAESVHRSGVRRLVLFNSHGGQPEVMRIVAQDLRARLGMLAVPVSWTHFGLPEGIFGAHELRHGIHAGAVETSMMLHLRPDSVRRSELRDFPSLSEELERDGGLLQPLGRIAFAWQAQDLGPAGAVGAASRADADRGARLVAHAAASLARLLLEAAAFDLGRLRDSMAPAPPGFSQR